MTTFKFINILIIGHWHKLDGISIINSDEWVNAAIWIVRSRAEKVFLKGVSLALDFVEAIFKVFLFLLNVVVTIAYFIHLQRKKFSESMKNNLW